MKEPGSNPTILVPGFAGGKTLFHPFRDELRARGVAAECWELAPFVYRRRISWYGELLAQTVAEHDAGVGITLVGWSMGGFVSVAAALDPAVRGRIRRVITFGTPWNGTSAACIGVVTDHVLRLNVREMRPGSPFIRSLIAGLDDPARHWDFHAVNGTYDPLARAPMRGLDPAWCHAGPWWHRSLLGDARLFDLIHRLIELP